MKLETMLNALEYAKYLGNLPFRGPPTNEAVTYNRRLRQYRAFRARILRKGNDSEEAYYNGVSAGMDVREETIRQKDAEIEKLNARLDMEHEMWLAEHWPGAEIS